MNVSVLGLGYIGLPTAAMLAAAGHTVYGYDVDRALCSRLGEGVVTIAEPEVQLLVSQALAGGGLRVAAELREADAYILCTPTPTVDARPDLRAVEAAAAAVARMAKPGALVVMESTVPPGTTERIVCRALREAGKDPDAFLVAHCPERVLPGNIVHELRTNARILGGRTPQAAAAARELYASFCVGELVLTDCTTAELVKVVENTYRDVNIAFANELAVLAEEIGVDVWETIALANNHPRVSILAPGPGVGGHCIPIDPHFLSNANPFVTELIQTARRVNERMPHRIVRRIAEYAGDAPGTRVALLGAAYKADVDDARETPTQRVDELLSERGYEVRIYDPLVKRFPRALAPTLEEALRDADAAVLMVAHRAFLGIDPYAAGRLMRAKILIDTRNAFAADAWRAAGFTAYTLGGRPRALPVALPV